MRAEKFRVCSATEPAIDRERMPWSQLKKYIETADFSLVEPYLDMQKAIIWHIQAIPQQLFAWVDAIDHDSYRHGRAYMAGVVMIENMPQPDGSITTWVSKQQTPDKAGMTEEESWRVSPEYRKEIGRIIYEHSFLDRRKDLRLHPLPMWERYLVEADFHGAEENQNTAGGNS